MSNPFEKIHSDALSDARAAVAEAKEQVKAELARNKDCGAKLTAHTVNGAVRRAVAKVNAVTMLAALAEDIEATLLAENGLKAEPVEVDS